MSCITEIKKVEDVWCGWNFNENQKIIINELVLREFERPVRSRLTLWDLIKKVKYVK